MSDDSVDQALNPNVVRLGLVSFFADIASEMLYPITPIFLTSILGSSMTTLGIIEGFAEGLASLLKTYSGMWSDSISRRKPFIIVGYFLGAISKPFIGISTTWLHVFLARALDRTGKGIRSAPRDALLAESVSFAKRGAAFGWHRSMDTAGAALGPLLTIYILSLNSGSLRPLYYWALLPGLTAVFLILFVKEKSKPKAVKQKWQNPLQAWPQFDSSFKKYILAWGVFSLANSSDVFLIMKAKSSGLTMTTVILIYCFYNLVNAVLSPALGKLSDRIDRRKILSFGLITFSLVYFGFCYASKLWHFWLLFAVYGIYMAATDGVGKAYAVDLTPVNLKASGLGLLGSVTGVCTIFASLAAGLIWDHFGSNATFLFGAFGGLIACMLIILNHTFDNNNRANV